MNKRQTIGFLLAPGLLLAACSPQPTADLRGTWRDTLTAANGNTDDPGTITSSGGPVQGTPSEVNFTRVTYTASTS